jgi:hypothetical protein
MKNSFLKRITVIVISSFCLLNVSGQTLENQLLSQLHSTKNTGESDANKWTKVAECTITQAYDDLGGVIDFLGTGSSEAKILYGRIIARFKNQNPTVTSPNKINLALLDSNLGAENVKAIINGTNVKLYG